VVVLRIDELHGLVLSLCSNKVRRRARALVGLANTRRPSRYASFSVRLLGTGERRIEHAYQPHDAVSGDDVGLTYTS
jgi:hypothetical protein